MGIQFNNQDDDAYRMASRLAQLTGESMTAAVTRALRAELARVEQEGGIDAEVHRMLDTARDIRAHMREPVSSDVSDLYDEQGLPR